MTKKTNTPIGTIEGFFGRAWTFSERFAHIDFLAQQGANFYIYAPKNDPYLRRNWQTDWPNDAFLEITALRQHCADRDIAFGIGLSPFEAHTLTTAEQTSALTQRMRQINALKPDFLGIFFDDMRGDTPHLAAAQIHLVHLAQSLSTAKKIIFCPTYYSADPVLEKVFGQMPSNYFCELRKNLNKEIDIFWTGEKVCSREYSDEHLIQVAQLLGRKPFIWDNYPVNDGAIKSQFLHLSPVPDSLHNIQNHIAGRAINPMNQAYLSQFSMISSIAAQVSTQKPVEFRHPLAKTNWPLWNLIQSNLIHFEKEGLAGLSPEIKTTLSNELSEFLPNPFAQEALAWLQGEYTFDPACLTD